MLDTTWKGSVPFQAIETGDNTSDDFDFGYVWTPCPESARLFAQLTGDYNPIHDPSASTPKVHGAAMLAIVSGMMFDQFGHGTTLASLGQPNLHRPAMLGKDLHYLFTKEEEEDLGKRRQVQYCCKICNENGAKVYVEITSIKLLVPVT